MESLAKYRLVVPDSDTGTIWADLMAISRRKGVPLSIQDAWVAATAVNFELTLVTLVTHDKDFIEYPGLNLIRRMPTVDT